MIQIIYALKLTLDKQYKKTNCSQGLGLKQGAARHPADPTLLEETRKKEGSLGQCASFHLIDAGYHAERLLHTKQTHSMTTLKYRHS